MNKTLIALALVAVLIVVGLLIVQDNKKLEITSFEECVAAGNPVMLSYPPRCKTADGKTFTEELPVWKTDRITMMRLPEGNVACFGCGATKCISPIPGLEVVEETEEQHCTDALEVAGSET